MSELTEMEKYLQKLFTEAGQDLKKKFLKYTQDFQRLDAERQQAVKDGRMTEDEYKEWRKNKLLYGMHWQRMIDKDTKELLRYNETALRYINGETPQIFASGYNSVVEKVPDSPVGGYDFELVNADTAKNIVHEEGIILPKKKLDPEKDVAWNAKLINAQLLQGILQGESIPEMAKRMQTVANSDLAGATRTARTMHTAAQNCGRQTGYNKAAKQGIIFEKTWMAAHDERTRSTHAEMDGQTVAYDAMFVSPSGAELEFPADWRAPAAEVYNCRCTMITKFKGFMSLKDAENVPDRETPTGNKAEDYEWIDKSEKTAASKAPEKEKSEEETTSDIEETENSNNAVMFEHREDADKLHRPYLDSIWDTLTIDEKYAIYEYTRGSNGFNQPLAGYNYHRSSGEWNKNYYVGALDTDWDSATGSKHVPFKFLEAGASSSKEELTLYRQAIIDLTNAIEKSELPQDTYLKRCTTINGLAGMFQDISFDDAIQIIADGDEKTMQNLFIGKRVVNHIFTSTGIANDIDNGANVKYNILAPKGTKAIYVEPQSNFGETARNAPYVAGTPYNSVGGEAEMLVQRGTIYRITGFKARAGNFEVDMEIVEQPNYFVYGDEDTANGGATRHK